MSTHQPYAAAAAVPKIASDKRIAIVAARWNEEIVGRLLSGALQGLAELGVAEENISVFRCPGSYEIPLVAKACVQSGRFAGVITLGCVIRGDTYHFELVADAVSAGVLQVSLESGVPILLGVLTTENQEQALARAAEGPNNKGWECAYGLAELLDLLGRIA